MTIRPQTAPTTRSTPLTVAGGLVLAAVLAVAADAVVAAIAHGAGASHAFRPLQPATYGGLTVVGILAGAVGWALIRVRSSSPRRLLRTLVPAVLVLSFIPDVLVAASASMPGTSWGAVAALMGMHVLVAAVAIPVYVRVLPLPAER
jgi:hypothetical protein